MKDASPTDRTLLKTVCAVPRQVLPPDWQVVVKSEPRRAGPDFIATLTAPSGESVTYLGEFKRISTSSDVRTALDHLRTLVEQTPGALPLFAAPWLSEGLRQQLSSQDMNFVDATGNARLTSQRPGLFVTAQGAAKNPWPIDKTLQSLRGTGSRRALRALLDLTPPYGVRELAGRTEASAPTLSRVLDLLDREGLVERDDKGLVIDLDWAKCIRRWTQDYDVLGVNDRSDYLQPRGLPALAKSLESAKLRYALTGSMAAREFAPIAPARLAMLYVDNAEEAASAFELRRADAGANVVLLEPYDDVVYVRGVERSGLQIVNPTQLAVDLLTGPGRAPSEGEALLDWMKDNNDAWRA